MKVLVADDHEFVRCGLVSELKEVLRNAIFVESSDAAGVLKTLESDGDIKLAILDLYMPDSHGYKLIDTVCKTYPNLIVVVITASEDSKDMRAAHDCGASGYIPKTAGKDVVLYAIQLILAGGTYFPKEIFSASMRNDMTDIQKKVSELTKRQKEVLKLLLEGKTNKNIANTLNLAENTVKIHVTAILRTLGFDRRAQVIAAVSEIDPNLYE
ncbi:LuxR C-terminal-related transcriptional regulator [Pseudomonadota bacterium]